MNRRIKIGIILIITSINLCAEKPVSKEEFKEYWIKTKQSRPWNSDDYKIQLDSSMVIFIGELRVNGVDTIGAFQSISVGAYNVSDTCSCRQSPWYGYVQWIKNGITFHRMFKLRCTFSTRNIPRSFLIDFYDKNKEVLNKEQIMFVITKIYRDKKGEIQYEFSMQIHTVNYFLYCYINGISKFIKYEDFDVEAEDNIFRIDNLNSYTNQWRIGVENQINEIEK